jgi:hypothetical protein
MKRPVSPISSPAGGGARRAEGDSAFIAAAVFVLGDRVPLRPCGPPPPAEQRVLKASGRRALSIAFLALLSACTEAPPPTLAPQPGPDDPAAPSADMPYRPVMAGTTDIGVGAAP